MAVISISNRSKYSIEDTDIRIEFYSGTGKGGQHRNKHQNSVRAIHIPSGTIQTCQGRDKAQNIKIAKEELKRKLLLQERHDSQRLQHNLKQKLMGSGERGDKIRTYRFQDDICKDHRSKKQMSVSQIMNGEFWKIW